MAKTAFDLTSVVSPYLERLEQELDLDRVLFVDEHYGGIDGALSDVRFIVISSSFDGMDHLARSKKLGMIGAAVNPAIQAWAFTPDEVARHFSGEKYDLFLAQFLTGSREVYAKPPKGSARKAAGGKR